MIQKIAPEQIVSLMAGLSQWRYQPERGGSITRDFTFIDFNEAFGFMTRVVKRLQSRNDYAHHARCRRLVYPRS
jgi:pterin-4a-carbinolamine dehydratase